MVKNNSTNWFITIFLNNMHIMLAKCLLKIGTSAVTHPPMQLKVYTDDYVDAFYQDEFYGPETLECN